MKLLILKDDRCYYAFHGNVEKEEKHQLERGKVFHNSGMIHMYFKIRRCI